MELPRLQTLHDRFSDEGFQIVAVEATGDTERATQFIEDKGLTYTFVEDGDDTNVVSGLFDVHSFPTSFLIDRDGRIMYFHEDFEPGDEEKIAAEIETLL